MTKIKILVAGYAKRAKNGWLASSSCVLIQDKGYNIIVDPGTNRKLLLKNLAKENLKPKDINLVFLTHYHPDHWLAIDLFPRVKVLDGDIVYQDDKEIGFTDKIPQTNIKIIATPGHAYEHASLLVKTSIGRMAIVGDLFWWPDGRAPKITFKNLINLIDPYVKDKKALIASRKKILKMADYIIPGHGQVVKV